MSSRVPAGVFAAFAAPLLAVLLGGCATPYAGEPSYRPAALSGAGRTPEAARVPPPGAAAPRPGEPPGPTVVLRLEDCIRIALENYRKIRIADRKLLITNDQRHEAIASLLPKVTAEGRYQARNNDPGGQLGGNAFVTGEREAIQARLSVLVPIYDSTAWTAYDAAHLASEVAAVGSDKARQDVVLAVSQAYFRVLEARQIRSVVEESIRVIDRQLEIARDFFAQGMVARSDVLTVEVQRAERIQDLIRAEHNEKLAVATLNRQMGLEVTRPTAIADIREPAPWRGSFETALALAIERRPDLASLRLDIEIGRVQYRLTRGAGFTPRIYGFGEYNYTSDEFVLNKDWLVGGLFAELPIFEGGATYYQLDRREQEIADLVDLHDERVDDVVLELQKAYLDMRESYERIGVAKKAIELAEENLRTVRDQYVNGLATSADVLLEEDRLSRARSNYYRSLYDQREASARLAHATGGTLPD